MYIGKYERREEEGEAVVLPKNYAGNAFSAPPGSPEKKEKTVCEDTVTESSFTCTEVPSPTPHSSLPPEALLLLLSLFFSQNNESEDLSLLLMLLLVL